MSTDDDDDGDDHDDDGDDHDDDADDDDHGSDYDDHRTDDRPHHDADHVENGKTPAPAVVFEQLAQHLQRWPAEHGDLVFRRPDGKPWARSRLERSVPAR